MSSTGPDAIPPHVHLRAIPGKEYDRRELGPAWRKTPADIVEALSLVKKGEIYDLDSGRWVGMPGFPAHPPFVMAAYRSPHGVFNQGDLNDFLGRNTVNMALNTEYMTGTAHTGTHIDALNHITCGEDSHWYGGYSEAEHLGDFGPMTSEGSSLPPLICRGVLVDVPALRGVDILDGEDLITLDDVQGALERQRTEVRAGDAVLIRTGYMQAWGFDAQRAQAHFGSGIGHDVAAWLADQRVVAVGGDNESLERNPSPDPDNPHPVHIELLVDHGIHILEFLHVEDLARDEVYEFCFVCLPLRIRHATGSMVRPVALI
jgi:kynurenine formamidase